MLPSSVVNETDSKLFQDTDKDDAYGLRQLDYKKQLLQLDASSYKSSIKKIDEMMKTITEKKEVLDDDIGDIDKQISELKENITAHEQLRSLYETYGSKAHLTFTMFLRKVKKIAHIKVLNINLSYLTLI